MTNKICLNLKFCISGQNFLRLPPAILCPQKILPILPTHTFKQTNDECSEYLRTWSYLATIYCGLSSWGRRRCFLLGEKCTSRACCWVQYWDNSFVCYIKLLKDGRYADKKCSTVSVMFPNGSFHDVARLEAGPTYQSHLLRDFRGLRSTQKRLQSPNKRKSTIFECSWPRESLQHFDVPIFLSPAEQKNRQVSCGQLISRDFRASTHQNVSGWLDLRNENENRN